MSQLTPAGVSVTQQLRTHWILALSALLALLATAALVLVLAIDRGSSQTSTAVQQSYWESSEPRTSYQPTLADSFAAAIGNSTAQQSYWESSEPRTSYQPAPADSFKDRGGPAVSQSTPGARAPSPE
jgi:hypothetical protein